MRELLHLLPRPGHYVGEEDGAISKNPAEVKLHIALAFPDVYEVGMSYLGQKILYGIVNERPDWLAERVMAPEREAGEILRKHDIPLSTIESDTPLKELAAVCFSVTHELCYTDILNMLDLAGIPLRTSARPDDLFSCPVIMAGGGAMIGAEPVSPFFDLVALGDGEELLPEILELLAKCREERCSRKTFLTRAAGIPGVYVPAFFDESESGGYEAIGPHPKPARRVVADLEACPYPERQVAPLGAVHNRLSLEIGRGCTRGCRFCHAGMVYRPARERKPETVLKLLDGCLANTGYDEVSFLALSAGDCTALKTIYQEAWQRCREKQVALCLPSLRVGSVDDEIMGRMAEIRRPGATLAPEAGSQRLRDIINKGITEEQLLLHIRKLMEHGWRQVKLYFMIGLPGETDADLDEIIALCRKVRDAGGPGNPKLNVTAAISPFVPKPFTPFQWEAQPEVTEIERRIAYLRQAACQVKGLRLKWHDPVASHLEAIMARGDRRIADVIELAFRKGALFCGWNEFFDFRPWQEALAECGITGSEYTRARSRDERLPWDHIEAGVSREFLWRERERSLRGEVTPDCKFGECAGCGACDIGKSKSRLAGGGPIGHKLVFASRDQANHAPRVDGQGKLLLHHEKAPALSPNLAKKVITYRVWHRKIAGASWLSHLELQAALMRALRRAEIPMAFSQGYHPLPLLSFGRALPVGVESEAEWFGITLAEMLGPEKLKQRLARFLPPSLAPFVIEVAPKKTQISVSETYALESGSDEIVELGRAFAEFSEHEAVWIKRETKKGEKEEDLRPYLLKWNFSVSAASQSRLIFVTDWSAGYVSPVLLTKTILASDTLPGKLVKLTQTFEDGQTSR